MRSGHCFLKGETAGIYQINKDQAQIVLRIMQDYVAGHSPRTIASELNAEGVEAPRGWEWRASTINGQRQAGNGILNNELYIGKRIWNRRHKVTDPQTGKKRMRPAPESEWTIIETQKARYV